MNFFFFILPNYMSFSICYHLHFLPTQRFVSSSTAEHGPLTQVLVLVVNPSPQELVQLPQKLHTETAVRYKHISCNN